ncbi:hypothetical protein VTO73DRAFT_10148 [Trametes versicolor]
MPQVRISVPAVSRSPHRKLVRNVGPVDPAALGMPGAPGVTDVPVRHCALASYHWWMHINIFGSACHREPAPICVGLVFETPSAGSPETLTHQVICEIG